MHSHRWGDVVALSAGLSLPFAFAPFNFFPLAIVAPAALFHLWRDGSPGRAAWRGFLFGLGMFGVGVSWVYVSMHNFGNMPPSLAALATAILVAALALYPAALGYAQARWCVRPHWLHPVLVLPALWILFEWWRGWFLTGFPWLNLGYSQIDSVLSGYAPVAGVYGVGFMTALIAGLCVQIFHQHGSRVPGFIAVVSILLGGFALQHISWSQPMGSALRVSLVQGNIALRDKWNPAKLPAILEQYQKISFSAPPSDLIVWPEAAIPTMLTRLDPKYLSDLRKFSRERGTDFLIGVIEYDPSVRAYYNSVVSVGSHEGVYRKQHLVPFGEYVPLKPLFHWLMGSLDIPMSNLRPAPEPQRPLRIADQWVGVSVCYEDAFGEEIVRAVPAASLLINVSEDAWFGASLAPQQRLQMARMRALEAARPMLRAANTGPSVSIDHRGRIDAQSPQFKTYLLHTQIQPVRGTTLYARTGNWLVVFMAAIVLLLCQLTLRKMLMRTPTR